ncbi:MAG: hypothetical protein NTW68_05200 [candidate division NC10 bacterium]|nr:hypothetical protein [candidate division NC10 bacterium]
MKRERWSIRVAVLFVLGLALSACAADGTFKPLTSTSTPYPPSGYMHTVQTSHVVLYWNCAQPEAGVLRLEGAAYNPWMSAPVQYLEFELEGVDAMAGSVSEGKAAARDIQIHTNRSSPFQIDLRTTGKEVRYDLYYQYRMNDGQGGNRMDASLDWDGPVLFAQQNRRFSVRDACSDTQHLVR